jgi:hypothetical protein
MNHEVAKNTKSATIVSNLFKDLSVFVCFVSSRLPSYVKRATSVSKTFFSDSV